MTRLVNIKLERQGAQYPLDIGHDLLGACGEWARQNLSAHVRKIAMFSNELVFSLYGKVVSKSLEDAGFEVFVWLMNDGEKYKNFESLKEGLNYLSEVGVARTDAIVSLGGGVVSDLAGFASAIHLRGIQFVQIPTTLLAMIDASVGGKTGINTDLGKNLVGTFKQPVGVLIDANTLKTLDRREITAGFCEVIKQGAIGSRELFGNVAEFLSRYSIGDFSRNIEDDAFLADLESLIVQQVSFKASVVKQDETESIDRDDKGSRKILNFGHTVAHALEKVTDYSYFRHGEAVGYGILAAGEISKRLDIFDEYSLRLLNDVVSSAGILPPAGNIDTGRVVEAFTFDKKNLGKSLHWILLEAIGTPTIVQDSDIPRPVIIKSLEKILAG